jgi:peroxiredoxin
MRHVIPFVRRSSSRLVLGVIAAALLAGGASAASVWGPHAQAPTFTVTDVAGTKLDLATLLQRGPVLLDFWATWCRPCVESMPELERWHHDYGPRGLTVIGISVDGPRNAAKVRPFAASHGATYPIVVDRDGALQERYHVVALPTAFLIDTAGVIRRVRLAYRPGEDATLERDLQALLPPANTE